MTSTPGTNNIKIQRMITHLNIAKIEARSELFSPVDVGSHSAQTIRSVKVDHGDQITKIDKQLQNIIMLVLGVVTNNLKPGSTEFEFSRTKLISADHLNEEIVKYLRKTILNKRDQYMWFLGKKKLLTVCLCLSNLRELIRGRGYLLKQGGRVFFRFIDHYKHPSRLPDDLRAMDSSPPSSQSQTFFGRSGQREDSVTFGFGKRSEPPSPRIDEPEPEWIKIWERCLSSYDFKDNDQDFVKNVLLQESELRDVVFSSQFIQDDSNPKLLKLKTIFNLLIRNDMNPNILILTLKEKSADQIIEFLSTYSEDLNMKTCYGKMPSSSQKRLNSIRFKRIVDKNNLRVRRTSQKFISKRSDSYCGGLSQYTSKNGASIMESSQETCVYICTSTDPNILTSLPKIDLIISYEASDFSKTSLLHTTHRVDCLSDSDIIELISDTQKLEVTQIERKAHKIVSNLVWQSYTGILPNSLKLEKKNSYRVKDNNRKKPSWFKEVDESPDQRLLAPKIDGGVFYKFDTYSFSPAMIEWKRSMPRLGFKFYNVNLSQEYSGRERQQGNEQTKRRNNCLSEILDELCQKQNF